MNIAILITSVLLIFTIVFALFKINNPDNSTFLGFKPIVITSQSMEPEIMTGGLVIARETAFEEIEVGDIITFEDGAGDWITHKVERKTQTDLWTKGVNNNYEDNAPVSAGNYKYKVVMILNWVSELNTPGGIIKYLVLPVLGVFAVLAVGIIIFLGARNRIRKKKVLTAEFENTYTQPPDSINNAAFAEVNTAYNLKEDLLNTEIETEITNQKFNVDVNKNEQENTIYCSDGDTGYQLEDLLEDIDISLLEKINIDNININAIDFESMVLDEVTLSDVLSNASVYFREGLNMGDNFQKMEQMDIEKTTGELSDEKAKKLVKAILALKAQNDVLKTKLIDSENNKPEYDNAAEINSEIVRENQSLKNELENIKNEVNKTNREIRRISSEKAELESKLASVGETSGEAEMYNNQILKLKHENSEYYIKNKNLIAEKAELESLLSMNKGAIGESKSLKNEVSELQERLSDTNRQMKNLLDKQEEFDSISALNSKLKAENERLNHEISTFREKLVSLNDQVKSLLLKKEEVTTIATANNRLKAENETLNKQLLDLQGKLAAMNSQIKDLLVKNSGYDLLTMKKEEIEKENQILLNGAKKQKHYIETVKNELTKSVSEKEALQAELSKSKEIARENEELKRLIFQQLNDIYKYNNEVQSLRSELAKPAHSVSASFKPSYFNEKSDEDETKKFDDLIASDSSQKNSFADSSTETIESLLKFYKDFDNTSK